MKDNTKIHTHLYPIRNEPSLELCTGGEPLPFSGYFDVSQLERINAIKLTEIEALRRRQYSHIGFKPAPKMLMAIRRTSLIGTMKAILPILFELE